MSSADLAGLVQLYFQQVDDFNSRTVRQEIPEEEWEAVLDATASETLKRMIGVSAVGSDDARAALQWLVKERTIEMEGDTLFERVAASLVGALQGYLERV